VPAERPDGLETEIVTSATLDEPGPYDRRSRQAERLRLLWERRRLFLRVVGIGLAASTLFAFLLPKHYTATTRLMPPDTQTSSGIAMMAAMAAKVGAGGAGGLGSMAGDLLGLKSSGALFIGVLKSQTSQDRLIEQFDLRKVYGTRLAMDARTRLDDNTLISEDRKSGIITINATDSSPQRAAAIAAAYVDELNFLVAELSTSAAHRERVFLEERLKAVKVDLDDASNQLAQFSSKNNTLDIQQEGKAMLDVAANLAGQMVAGQSQLEGLRQIYTENNPRVQSLNARVGELRKQLDKLGGMKVDPSLATAIPQSGDMPYPTIRNLPLLGVKYTDYYRRAKIQETVYLLLTEQYELAKVQEAKETPSVKVLDPARIPERKSSPSRLLIMCVGTLATFSVCVVWVFGAARWRETDPGDPLKIFAQEVAAAVSAKAPWASNNGHGAPTAVQTFWSRFNGRRPPTDGPTEP
jgi:capsule polysaccharide export protein KpsE/RkpR